ncbi:MAG: diacylglycerol kinase family lipid kinase [Lachnospiraceae bacterium]|nr:diacylglycerol kinase family lipid kinase [Lachnospiraceae bacterium]
MLHIVYNPQSSTGNGKKVFLQVEKVLIEENVEYKVYETTGAGSAKMYAKDITSDDSNDVIIVIGGDGTLNEVFNGIKDYSKVTLGYIPSGSGGDFARDLKISTDPEKAIRSILHPKEYKIMDVGNLTNAECNKRFCVSAGIGFDAAVCHEALHSKLKIWLNKVKLGKLTYVVIALKQILSTKKHGCTIILDDARKIKFDHFYFVTTMIHRYEGGGFMFCPKAKYDDGLIDVCVASNISKLKVLCLMPLAYKGKHTKFKGIETYTAKKIQIFSDEKLPIHTDGEYAGVEDELVVTLCSKQIRVIIR